MASAVHFYNCLDITERDAFFVNSGLTVREWLAQSGFDKKMEQQPIVVIFNGEELLEKDFDTVLTHDDLIALWTLPEWAAVGWVIAFIVEYWAIIQFVIMVALYLTQPEPDIPESAKQNEGSPTYALSSRGNRARLGQPKPVVYGRMRVYPDLSALPLSQFENGSDQYLYQLFEVTQGIADISVASIRFDETPLSAFDNYDVEVIPPGEKSWLYPHAVDVSSEVDNLLITAPIVGPYTVVAVGGQASRLAWDIVAPGGLYRQDDQGNLLQYWVRLGLGYREIDDAGNPVGGWITVGVSIIGANRTPVRKTWTLNVTPGRYQVRLERITPKDSSLYVSDTVNWVQAKAFLVAETGVTNTTRVAIKIRASEQIGNKALAKMNCVCERQLQSWDAVNGWGAHEFTDNVAWVFADIARASYGGNRDDAHIDLNALQALAAQFDSEGTGFNGVFDTSGNVWEALTKVAQVARCMPVDHGGVYTMVRDSYSTTPVMMFTQRNIVKDSFNISYAGVLQETADAVRVIFNDRDQDYRQVDVLCALPGSPAANPRELRYFGVTDKDQAFKLGMGLAAENQYRRETITFDTAMDGLIPFYGDVVAISHYLIGRERSTQVSGEVRKFDGVDTLTLTERVSGFVDPFIVIKSKSGAPGVAYQCEIVADNKVRIIESFDDDALVFEPGYDRPHFMLGEGSVYFALIKVRKVEPLDNKRFRISGFVDDPRVYTAADGLDVPPIDVLPAPVSLVPRVTNLGYSLAGTIDAPRVILSWAGENADYYEVQFSQDGVEWFPFTTRPVQPTFTDTPAPGVVRYRVAGVNIFRGVWSTVIVDTSEVEYSAPPAITNLVLAEPFVGRSLKISWASEVLKHRLIFTSGANTYQVTVDALAYELPVALALSHGLGRSFAVEVFAVGLNNKLALASPVLTVANPSPAVLSNIAVDVVGVNAIVSFDVPSDPDFVGVSIWLGSPSGFTPSAGTLVIDRTLDPVVQVPLAEDVEMFMRIAGIDAWGNTIAELNLSGEYSVTGGSFNFDLAAIDITEPLADLPSIANKFADIDDDVAALIGGFNQLSSDAVVRDETIVDLGVAVGEVESGVASNAQAIVDGDAALAQQITTVSAVANAAQAAANQNATAIVDGDTALAQQITTVSAVANAAQAAANQNATAIVDGDAALAQQINTLTTTVGSFQASIDQNSQAIIDNNNALTSQYNSLSTTVGGFSSSITTLNQSYNGIAAMRSVVIDNNGVISGYKLISEILDGTGTVSTMKFDVDNFLIASPGRPDRVVFGVDTVNNVLGMNGDVIIAGTVTANKLNVTQLSAITANLGTVTAGTFATTAGAGGRVEISSAGSYPIWIGMGTKTVANASFYVDVNGNAYFKGTLDVKSATTGERLEITGDVIKVFDAAGVLRVKIGNLD